MDRSFWPALFASMVAAMPAPARAQAPAWTDLYDSAPGDLPVMAAGAPFAYSFPLQNTRHLAVDASGDSYVAGTIDASAGGGSFLVRYTADGQPAWLRREAGRAIALALDGQGGVYLVGNAMRYRRPNTLESWFLEKYDDTGQRLWSRSWDGLVPDARACPRSPPTPVAWRSWEAPRTSRTPSPE